jgi:hypothetical protein
MQGSRREDPRYAPNFPRNPVLNAQAEAVDSWADRAFQSQLGNALFRPLEFGPFYKPDRGVALECGQGNAPLLTYTWTLSLS